MDRPDPVVMELRRRWAEGDRVRVERLLASHPALSHDPDRVLDLIYAELLLRERVGERPDAVEYAKRFPALAAAIRTQFEVHEAIDAKEELPEVPGYTVLRELGRGGAGAVYEAEDRTGKRVAAKLIRPDLFDSHTARKRFEIEARIGSLLDHPGIVPVYAIGDSRSGPFLVMELMASSLEALIREQPLSPANAVALLLPVAEAVHFAHTQSVVHRDLKPANILLSNAECGMWNAEGKTKTIDAAACPNSEFRIPHSALLPKVSDFGLAKLVARSLALGVSSTQQGVVLGTPAYMPPEQAAGKAQPGPTQDVYALGAVLFAAIAGRPPFDEGSPLATLLRVQVGRPPALRDVRPDAPVELDAICARCLSPKPEDRYPSAATLAKELRRYAPQT